MPWPPFAVVAVVAQASVALPPGPRLVPCYVASTLLLCAAAVPFVLPRRMVPAWGILAQSGVYLASAGLLMASGGTDPSVPSTAGGLSAVVLLPVIGVALYRPRSYALPVVLAAAGTNGLVGLATHNDVDTIARRLVLWAVIGGLVSVAVHTLREHLEAEIEGHAELARQAELLSGATRRLTSLHDPAAVVAEGTRLIAELASPRAVGTRRALYLRVEGDTVVQDSVFDELDSSPPISCRLADHPYVRGVLETGRPVAAAIDLEACGPSLRPVLERLGVTDAVWLPVHVGGSVHGIVVVTSRGAPLSEQTLARCADVADLVELALVEALRRQTLEREATTDVLTGLVNRRGLRQAIDERRHRHPYAVLMMDVDGLKGVNDTFGHAAGDDLIVAVARVAAAGLRVGDVLGRVGGDEFVAFLADAGPTAAAVVARRISAAVAAVCVSDVPARVSIGIACGAPGEDPDEVTRRADEALYRAKSGGGGRCVVDGAEHVAGFAGRRARPVRGAGARAARCVR